MKKRILIIQTAFIGDAVLATSVIEKIREVMPNASIDLLVREGNECLFYAHPFVRKTIVWNKNKNKYKTLWNILRYVRERRYHKVINLQRFASTGFLTAFSNSDEKYGFTENPFSIFFTHKVEHGLSKGIMNEHEVDRYNRLLTSFAPGPAARPKIYPSALDDERAASYAGQPFITISPGSVWSTKRTPVSVWVDWLKELSGYRIYFLGAKGDRSIIQKIMKLSGHSDMHSLAGDLSFLQSAALMKRAVMNYSNDSAPLHFCSAMNAPITGLFCSTVPAFGFTPLSDRSFIAETSEKLTCRPCGLHGHAECPEGHFKCGYIDLQQLRKSLAP